MPFKRLNDIAHTTVKFHVPWSWRPNCSWARASALPLVPFLSQEVWRRLLTISFKLPLACRHAAMGLRVEHLVCMQADAAWPASLRSEAFCKEAKRDIDAAGHSLRGISPRYYQGQAAQNSGTTV